MKEINKLNETNLLQDVCLLIEEGRQQLSHAANATITYTYWRIGKRINNDVLKNKVADFGKQIVVLLARQLATQYGKSHEEKNRRGMMRLIHWGEGSNEQIELLQLENPGIKVAGYFTELPVLKLLKQKLHTSILNNRKLLKKEALPEITKISKQKKN